MKKLHGIIGPYQGSKDFMKLWKIVFIIPISDYYFSAAYVKGEQRALTWRDLHFEEGYINIDKTNYNGQVHKPKTKMSKRKVYIPNHVIDDLTAYKEWNKENYPYKEDYVVFGSFYQSIGETTVAKRYNALLRKRI